MKRNILSIYWLWPWLECGNPGKNVVNHLRRSPMSTAHASRRILMNYACARSSSCSMSWAPRISEERTSAERALIGWWYSFWSVIGQLKYFISDCGRPKERMRDRVALSADQFCRYCKLFWYQYLKQFSVRNVKNIKTQVWKIFSLELVIPKM